MLIYNKRQNFIFRKKAGASEASPWADEVSRAAEPPSLPSFHKKAGVRPEAVQKSSVIGFYPAIQHGIQFPIER